MKAKHIAMLLLLILGSFMLESCDEKKKKVKDPITIEILEDEGDCEAAMNAAAFMETNCPGADETRALYWSIMYEDEWKHPHKKHDNTVIVRASNVLKRNAEMNILEPLPEKRLRCMLDKLTKDSTNAWYITDRGIAAVNNGYIAAVEAWEEVILKDELSPKDRQHLDAATDYRGVRKWEQTLNEKSGTKKILYAIFLARQAVESEFINEYFTQVQQYSVRDALQQLDRNGKQTDKAFLQGLKRLDRGIFFGIQYIDREAHGRTTLGGGKTVDFPIRLLNRQIAKFQREPDSIYSCYGVSQ